MDKPRIRKVVPYFFGIKCAPIWVCEGSGVAGLGETVGEACKEWIEEWRKPHRHAARLAKAFARGFWRGFTLLWGRK